MVSEVLVCDDQPEVLTALDLLLKGAGYRAGFVQSPSQALGELNARRYDVVLTDMNFTRDTTAGHEGLQLIERICREPEHPPVVVMTAWSDVGLAVEAVRRGATGFVEKPWDNGRLLDTLERSVREARAGREEMDMARMVQRRLLPPAERTIGGVRFRASFQPASEVGGDYYDFFDLGGGRFSFLLADVSGKGVPAALLMANLQALFHAQPRELLADPVALTERINELFHGSTAPQHYATMFYGVFGEPGEIRYVNCGHPPASVIRAFGGEDPCMATGLPLGLFASARFEEARVDLRAGDRFVVQSDGIVEADVADDDCTEIAIERIR